MLAAFWDRYFIEHDRREASSIQRVDVLVSWNFQHIVNWSRIRAFNSVNLKLGYPQLEIRSPQEVCYED